MLTGEEEIKALSFRFFKRKKTHTYFAEEPVWCKWHTKASTCTLFPEKFPSNTGHRCSLIKNSWPAPAGECTHFLLGAEGFFVRLDPNHKHLKEPASLGVSCSHHLLIDPPKSFQLMPVFQSATFNASG